MIEVRRIADWAHASALKNEWNAMVNAGAGGDVAVPSLFQTFEWHDLWWKAFGGSDSELLLLAAFDGTKLVGIAPLIIGRKKFPIPSKVLRFIGVGNFASDYCSFILTPGREEILPTFFIWLDAHPELWDELELTNLLENSADIPALEKKFAGLSKLYYVCDAPTRFLGNPDEDRELVNKKSLKRHYNWFKNQGTLTHKHWDTKEDIHARLDGFFEQHIGRRALVRDTSQLTQEAHRNFYRTLVDTMAPLGWLRFFTVELNGETFAHHFGFEFAGKFYWYKPCFDSKLVKKSPGEVLLKALFEDSISRKLKEFDFTAGSEAFKYRFSNRVRKLYQFRAFRTSSRYALFKAEISSRAMLSQILKPFRKKTEDVNL